MLRNGGLVRPVSAVSAGKSTNISLGIQTRGRSKISYIWERSLGQGIGLGFSSSVSRAWVFLIGFQCLVNFTPYVSKQKYSHGHGKATHSRAKNFFTSSSTSHMQLLVPFSWACHLNPKICSRVGMSLDRVSGSHSAALVRASVRHRSIHAGEQHKFCQ